MKRSVELFSRLASAPASAAEDPLRTQGSHAHARPRPRTVRQGPIPSPRRSRSHPDLPRKSGAWNRLSAPRATVRLSASVFRTVTIILRKETGDRGLSAVPDQPADAQYSGVSCSRHAAGEIGLVPFVSDTSADYVGHDEGAAGPRIPFRLMAARPWDRFQGPIELQCTSLSGPGRPVRDPDRGFTPVNASSSSAASNHPNNHVTSCLEHIFTVDARRHASFLRTCAAGGRTSADGRG